MTNKSGQIFSLSYTHLKGMNLIIMASAPHHNTSARFILLFSLVYFMDKKDIRDLCECRVSIGEV